MARFFIDRPIFAWVIAIIIMLAGVLSLSQLPISRYPDIAPPSVTIGATYPGASAQAVENSVTQVIEQAMTGLDGMDYMSSTSDSNGSVSVTLTFSTGTDPDIAQVQVQNKLQVATPLLPQIVQQQGLRVNKASSGFLQVIGFVSEDGSMGRQDISDYVSTNIVDPLSRVEGVGSVQVFGGKYAMRIWLDPGKLNTYRLAPSDIVASIRAQNAQVAVGQLGGTPAIDGQQINATITSQDRLQTPEQFRAIVLRSNADGSVLKLGDVARVELGSENYSVISRYNGQPASGLAVSLATGANALSTAQGIEALLERMRPSFPSGLRAMTPFDSVPFVRASIKEVVKTLLEAMVLVFLVMYLFLQNFRATLIPTIAVPVVLLGTLGVLLGLRLLDQHAHHVRHGAGHRPAGGRRHRGGGERRARDERGRPVAAEATRKSMDQITGAGRHRLVLAAVFVPMAFLAAPPV
jgi:multidrug efflux pump